MSPPRGPREKPTAHWLWTLAAVWILATACDGGSPEPSVTLDWLTEHPTTAVAYQLGDQIELSIPRDRSVTLQCAPNDLQISEIQIGTEGTDLIMEIRHLVDHGTGSPASESLAGMMGSQALVTGRAWNAGPPNPLWALTTDRMEPSASPPDTVQIRFAVDSAGGELTEAMAALDRQLRLGGSPSGITCAGSTH